MNDKKVTYADLERIDAYTQEEVDALPFGAIQLNREGIILKYNLYEGKLAGRDPQEVIGRNFFTEIAPCTNIQEFAGRFKQGIAEGHLSITFPYRFAFPSRSLDVEITMLASQQSDTGWILVKESKRPL